MALNIHDYISNKVEVQGEKNDVIVCESFTNPSIIFSAYPGLGWGGGGRFSRVFQGIPGYSMVFQGIPGYCRLMFHSNIFQLLLKNPEEFTSQMRYLIPLACSGSSLVSYQLDLPSKHGDQMSTHYQSRGFILQAGSLESIISFLHSLPDAHDHR